MQRCLNEVSLLTAGRAFAKIQLIGGFNISLEQNPKWHDQNGQLSPQPFADAMQNFLEMPDRLFAGHAPLGPLKIMSKV